MDILTGLNSNQKKAVLHTEGYLLVLALPGSGKTKLLTHRFAHILKEKNLETQNIMCVTFTNKAAREMKHRIKALLGDNHSNFWIGTFHGLCVRLLLKYGQAIGIDATFTIVDDKDQLKLIKELLEGYQNINLEPQDIIGLISRVKENLIKAEDILSTPSLGIISKSFPEFFRQYNDKLQQMNAMDFNDIINKTIYMMQSEEGIRNIIQEQFKYVMCDESQDLNRAQAEFVKAISGKYKNLMMVGDLDQNIYSWRGANSGIANAFSRHKDTIVMTLDTNYRSNALIVQAADALIKNNKERIDKDAIAHKDEGNRTVYYQAETEFDEAMFVSSLIGYLKDKERDYNYRDFAILFRTNNQVRILENSMIKSGIPYRILKGISLFEREEIKDTLSYMRLIVNPYDYLAFSRIIAKPKRGIAETGSKLILNYAAENNLSIFDLIDNHLGDDALKKLRKKDELIKLSETIKKYQELLLKGMAPYLIIKNFMTEVGYVKWLDKDEEKLMHLYDFIGIVETWNDSNAEDDQINSLVEMIQKFSLITDMEDEAGENTVTLTTCHGSKGCEWRCVFMVGLEEGLFPSRRNVSDPLELEEERRLFYVAMTRAKDQLYLSNVRNRRNFDGTPVRNKPSRFIAEIPEELVKKV